MLSNSSLFGYFVGESLSVCHLLVGGGGKRGTFFKEFFCITCVGLSLRCKTSNKEKRERGSGREKGGDRLNERERVRVENRKRMCMVERERERNAA